MGVLSKRVSPIKHRLTVVRDGVVIEVDFKIADFTVIGETVDMPSGLLATEMAKRSSRRKKVGGKVHISGEVVGYREYIPE